MLLACAVGLLLAASPAGAAAPGSETLGLARGNHSVRGNHSMHGNRDARAREAAGAFAARRYPQAAREFEALFAEFNEPGFLLAAGRSRLAAGHRAHAVAYLSRLLASGLLTASDTQVAYGELAGAQKAVTPVTLRVELPADLDHIPQLSAEYVGPHVDPRPALEFPLPTGAGPTRVLLLQLDPGAWRLRIADPALASVELVVDVLVQPGDPLQLDLRPHGPDLPRPKLVGVLTGLGGAALGAGVGVTVGGDLRVQRTLAGGACLESPDCVETLVDTTNLRSLGAGLLGAGAGAAIAGLTGLARDPQLRRRLWLVELAVGGAGLLGGGVALALAARGFNHDVADPGAQHRIEQRSAQHTIAAAGLGLGSGLAFAAIVALLRTRQGPQRRLQNALGLHPGGLGVSVSGRF